MDFLLASLLQPLFFDMRTWHLPSYFPDIYSSVVTYLRHTCKEKICEKLFFRSVAEKMECLVG